MRDRPGDVVAKRDVLGEWVVVLAMQVDARNLTLERLTSRVVSRNEIHELITTAEEVAPGDNVRDVAYLGFFEVSQGGSLRVGDLVTSSGRTIGRLAGFDVSHSPNHLNIVVQCDKRYSGQSLGLGLADKVRFSLD